MQAIKKHVLDAENQSLGRLASQVAVLLRGKDVPSFAHTVMPTVKVEIKNVTKMKFTGNKLEDKVSYHYSGFPGGMKARTLKNRMAEDPKRVLWMAVHNMLPQNRQRSVIMRNLLIHD